MPPKTPSRRKVDVSRSTLEELSADLTALSNPTRLLLLGLLTEPKYGGELSEALEMTRQSALKHIERLQERGFVRSYEHERDVGRVTEYVVDPKRLFALGLTIADLGLLEPEGGRGQGRDDTQLLGTEVPVFSRRPEPAGAILLVCGGPLSGHRLELGEEADAWTLGREDDVDLPLHHDPFISAHHARIERDGDGYVVVDRFSSNGTHVNYKRIPKGGRVRLSPGDVVSLGQTSMVFQALPH